MHLQLLELLDVEKKNHAWETQIVLFPEFTFNPAKEKNSCIIHGLHDDSVNDRSLLNWPYIYF